MINLSRRKKKKKFPTNVSNLRKLFKICIQVNDISTMQRGSTIFPGLRYSVTRENIYVSSDLSMEIALHDSFSSFFLSTRVFTFFFFLIFRYFIRVALTCLSSFYINVSFNIGVGRNWLFILRFFIGNPFV